MPKVHITFDEWWPVMECWSIEEHDSLEPSYDLTEDELQLINDTRDKFNQVQKLLADKKGDVKSAFILSKPFCSFPF